MTVEIEYVEEQTETIVDIVADPEDDDTVLSEMEDRGIYKVEREIVAVEEQYVAYTEDGMGKESRTYWIKENESGDWEVTKIRKSPNKGHATETERNAESTPAVREAMKERFGIELAN